jgi:hypothetical protein
MKSCAECAHFLPVGDDIGQCRRSAPTLQVVMNPGLTPDRLNVAAVPALWPPVKVSDWCGYFYRRRVGRRVEPLLAPGEE